MSNSQSSLLFRRHSALLRDGHFPSDYKQHYVEAATRLAAYPEMRDVKCLPVSEALTYDQSHPLVFSPALAPARPLCGTSLCDALNPHRSTILWLGSYRAEWSPTFIQRLLPCAPPVALRLPDVRPDHHLPDDGRARPPTTSFAFIEFETPEAAAAALYLYSGATVQLLSVVPSQAVRGPMPHASGQPVIDMEDSPAVEGSRALFQFKFKLKLSVATSNKAVRPIRVSSPAPTPANFRPLTVEAGILPPAPAQDDLLEPAPFGSHSLDHGFMVYPEIPPLPPMGSPIGSWPSSAGPTPPPPLPFGTLDLNPWGSSPWGV